MQRWTAAVAVAWALVACGETAPAPGARCRLAAGATSPWLGALGCPGDFEALASAPLAAGLPGARTVKAVIDRVGGDALYFQNTETFRTHWDFARAYLSGGGRPPVPDRATFNRTEYYGPARRFVLGALTHYAEPDAWVFEVAPYDTANAAMIAQAFRAVRDATWLGGALAFHPTSAEVEAVAAGLPADVPIVATEELLAGTRYQPLNLARAMGRLRFAAAEDVAAGALDFREIVVLARVPSDIAAVSGIVTAELQTPLAHVNVLSQHRGTPNMALVGALDDPALRALEGQWVELEVGAWAWSIRAVTREAADAWWEAHRPAPIVLPPPDLTAEEVRDAATLLDVAGAGGLGPALAAAIPAYGGKASHYAALLGLGEAVPVAPALVIPGRWYHEHLAAHGLDAEIARLLADPDFTGSREVRAQHLAALRAAIATAPVDAERLATLEARLTERFGRRRLRLRSSTNAEDLDGFSGAGLYASASAAVSDPERPLADALRAVWASTWSLRAFEERSYRAIAHRDVVMAVLVHEAFTDEEANGVALTANLYDPTGQEPGFVINVQKGEASVVSPEPGVTTDAFIYFYSYPGQPSVYLSHSNLISEGATVLAASERLRLGQALDAIHRAFYPLYGGRPGAFFAMDVEFKFDGPPGGPHALAIKQARPHPGWGLAPE